INDNDNHIEHENEQSNHINLPTINASDFLMFIAIKTENKTNFNIKKKKKKKKKKKNISTRKTKETSIRKIIIRNFKKSTHY
ncbi:hypothetical protein LLE78_12465, partial [Staphylococcus haemolyticus]|nr:hypothetical protein [Staphylococcus haemolyticus]